MEPEDVNPSNFKVEKIVYDDGDFAVARGVWTEDNSRRYAMRWNYTPNSDNGFPTSRGYPVWFQMPENFSDVIFALLKPVLDNKPEN